MAPDGKSVIAVLDSHNGHAQSIVSIRLSDGALTPLSATSTGTGDDADWHLSPDGRFVAIWEVTDAGDAISIASTRTGQRKRIAGPGKSIFLDGWAPDGSGLVLMSGEPGSRGVSLLRLSDGVPQGAAELLRGDLGNVFPFGLGPNGSYSYTKSTQIKRRHLAALDPATGKVSGKPELMPDLQHACGYDWSPDGSAIACGGKLNKGAGEKAPCTLVVLRSMTDGRERVLSPGMSEIRRPRWSPDGKSLLVFGRKDSTFGVFTVDVDANSAKLLVEASKPESAGEGILIGDWTPDGKGIYLGRRDSGRGSGAATSRLVYRDLATGIEADRYAIKAPGMIFTTTIAVSRDGSVAMLVAETDGSRAAVVVPPGDGPARIVYRVPASQAFSWVGWAGDGKALYVPERVPAEASQNVRKLVRVPIDGGAPTDAGLSFPAMDGTDPSPDGKRLVFLANENLVEIWAIDRLLPTRTGAAAAAKK